MSDDLDNEYARIDRNLSAQHQRYNTELMWHIKKLVERHDFELMVLSGVVVVLCLALGYDDYRIRRLYEEADKEPLAAH